MLLLTNNMVSLKTIRQIVLDYDPQTFTSPGLVILEARKLDADGELWLFILNSTGYW